MIGFYDYTVVVTYISLVSSILGMFCAIDGKLTLAVSCLAFSGLCDMYPWWNTHAIRSSRRSQPYLHHDQYIHRDGLQQPEVLGR